jgi:hypothetical protein
MKQYFFSQMGEYHDNYNEDFGVLADIGEKKQLIAVIDGCTMGKESHFAATLAGKLLRKIAKEMYYQAFIAKQEKPLPEMLKEVTQQLFAQLKEVKNFLALEREELLSTLLLGIVDTKAKNAEILCIGDGLVVCNGIFTEFEQENKPDYMGYHLDENFETWYSSQNQFISLSQIQDLSIATDGIFSFSPFKTSYLPSMNESEIAHFLLINIENSENENMLKRKVKDLAENYGLLPTDDLTIIRLIAVSN